MTRLIARCEVCQAVTTLFVTPVRLRRGDLCPPEAVEALLHPPSCVQCRLNLSGALVEIAYDLPDWFFGGVRIDGEDLRRQLTKERSCSASCAPSG